jgi:hypothetical protein
MSGVEDTIEEIQEMVRTVKVQQAYETLDGLLYSMGEREIRVWEHELRRCIEHFHPQDRLGVRS